MRPHVRPMGEYDGARRVSASMSGRRRVAVRLAVGMATGALGWAWVGVAHAGSKEDFFKAIELDRPQFVRSEVEAGFDPNTPDERGQTGLVLAMREGCFAAAEALLEFKQIEIDRPNAAGETPLMMAALRGHEAWVLRLLERGAAVNRTGWSPLHYAASGPEPKVVALLLARGAHIDALSPNGSTPLMMAAGYGAVDGAALLLSRGADARLRNRAGLDAAGFARRAGRDALADRIAAGVR